MILQALLWFLVSIIGGGTASLSGFGIGSLLTPVLAARYSVADAVLAVSIPHAIATAFRCLRLRRAIDWSVIRTFGIPSAIGAIAGAFLFLGSGEVLGRILGGLLVATGSAGLTGWNLKLHPSHAVSALLGVLSGLFGGMAGNQGGLRAAALTSYRLSPAEFVATSTAVGVMVDAARLPVYLQAGHARLEALWIPIAIGTAGVLLGTIAGERVLRRVSADRFRQVVSGLIVALGAWLLLR